LVVNIKSEEDLFSRRFHVVVRFVSRLALLIKNNTGDLAVVVVTAEADGD